MKNTGEMLRLADREYPETTGYASIQRDGRLLLLLRDAFTAAVAMGSDANLLVDDLLQALPEDERPGCFACGSPLGTCDCGGEGECPPHHRAPHDCGVCDGVLHLEGADGLGHMLYRCQDCGEAHTSEDCCDPHEVRGVAVPRSKWGPCRGGNHRDCAVSGCPCEADELHAGRHRPPPTKRHAPIVADTGNLKCKWCGVMIALEGGRWLNRAGQEKCSMRTAVIAANIKLHATGTPLPPPNGDPFPGRCKFVFTGDEFGGGVVRGGTRCWREVGHQWGHQPADSGLLTLTATPSLPVVHGRKNDYVCACGQDFRTSTGTMGLEMHLWEAEWGKNYCTVEEPCPMRRERGHGECPHT